jgi:hypothetical protein
VGERAHIAASRDSKGGAKVNDEERRLWRVGDTECVMVSCCSGADLQIRRIREPGDSAIVLREMYPMKSDLYDRARDLKQEHERAGRRDDTGLCMRRGSAVVS